MKRVIVLILILCSAKAFSQIQCTNAFTIKAIHSKKDQNSGKIEVNVESAGGFNCKLNTVTGSGIKTITEVKKQKSDIVYFENLKPGDSYQVLVIFEDESQGWCKRRQVSEIQILEE